jgi:hypothetical protein
VAIPEKKKVSLLEQALMGRKEVSGLYLSEEAKEEADLFVAWCDGTLDTSDVQRVLGIKTSGQVGTRAGACIRNAVKAGYLKIERCAGGNKC